MLLRSAAYRSRTVEVAAAAAAAAHTFPQAPSSFPRAAARRALSPPPPPSPSSPHAMQLHVAADDLVRPLLGAQRSLDLRFVPKLDTTKHWLKENTDRPRYVKQRRG